MLIETASINTGSRIRSIGEEQVNSLMNSIAEIGLLNPVTVYETDGGFGLIAGAHRLEACKRLGLVEIPAQVVTLSELDRQIAECDENLCAPHLTPAERAEFTARRKEAYEAKYPETKNGVIGALARHAPAKLADASFTADTAAKTGVSERKVQRDAEIGMKISDRALSAVKRTTLDTGVFLNELKEVPAKEQVAFVKRRLAAEEDRLRKNAENRKRASGVKRRGIDGDVKSRAATEVAEIIAEHIPGEWWDGLKANLYAAGAKNIADALTNITGQSIMDGRYAA